MLTQVSFFLSQFYLIINLAVGATGGYFPDVDLKPWKNGENAVSSLGLNLTLLLNG